MINLDLNKMNLDAYILEARKFDSDPAVGRLIQLFSEWKQDSSSVIQLGQSIERFFGNTWIEPSAAHEELYRKWRDFKIDAVDNIGGKTMNERLWLFSLLDVFDNAKPEERTLLYNKLLASAG